MNLNEFFNVLEKTPGRNDKINLLKLNQSYTFSVKVKLENGHEILATISGNSRETSTTIGKDNANIVVNDNKEEKLFVNILYWLLSQNQCVFTKFVVVRGTFFELP